MHLTICTGVALFLLLLLNRLDLLLHYIYGFEHIHAV